ncbi:hypothetical protein Csa_020209 [Cucumis sativus]|uniref:Uncharacterized protein n=1 Tax=Cucumis sativus TaxID=3659 RepID=A0A0A0K5R4_CUCSA|nr:hypothetical protein Csa_020209 [Cucumis sativus]
MSRFLRTLHNLRKHLYLPSSCTALFLRLVLPCSLLCPVLLAVNAPPFNASFVQCLNHSLLHSSLCRGVHSVLCPMICCNAHSMLPCSLLPVLITVSV